MLKFVKTPIFDSPAQTLVNTVNTVGVMGKGLAKDFKARFPGMFREYKAFCDSRELTIGALHVWRAPERWVLNFPTKTTWKLPSKLDYIERGLVTFRNHYTSLGIRSISFPPLGCGNGNLDWQDVKPVMTHYLWNLDIPIWIHEQFVSTRTRLEHDEDAAHRAPATYQEFLSDLDGIVTANHGRFCHEQGWPFRATFDSKERNLHVYLDREYVLGPEFIESAWVGLNLGILTPEHFGSAAGQRIGGYLIPMLRRLPYVRALTMGHGAGADSTGLYFDDPGITEDWHGGTRMIA